MTDEEFKGEAIWHLRIIVFLLTIIALSVMIIEAHAATVSTVVDYAQPINTTGDSR